MKPKRWQDWVNVTLGVWMVISPWALGFAGSQPPARSAWALGRAIVIIAGIGIYMHRTWEEVVNILLGIGLLASPWALGFSDHATASANAAITGLLVLAFAFWAMLKDLDLKKWRDEHRHAQGTR